MQGASGFHRHRHEQMIDSEIAVSEFKGLLITGVQSTIIESIDHLFTLQNEQNSWFCGLYIVLYGNKLFLKV